MTATIYFIDTQNNTATAARLEAEILLDALHDRIVDVAFTDPDELGSRHPAGREVLELAATARRATAALSGATGTLVTEAAGVVVVRELVAAARALAAAIALTPVS